MHFITIFLLFVHGVAAVHFDVQIVYCPTSTRSAGELQRYLILLTEERTIAIQSVVASISGVDDHAYDGYRFFICQRSSVGDTSQNVFSMYSDAQSFAITHDVVGRVVTVIGNTDLSTMYGTLALLENIGVQFSTAGVAVRSRRPLIEVLARLPITKIDAVPTFSTRGLQPFHDFAEGPDW
jgi:hypothetical protein